MIEYDIFWFIMLNVVSEYIPGCGYWKSFCVFLTMQELLQLEEDVKLLEEMYPQGEKVV